MTISTPTSVSVLKLGLPAGIFLVHAKVNLINLPGSDAVFVQYDLRLQGTTTSSTRTGVALDAPVTSTEAYEANVPLPLNALN